MAAVVTTTERTAGSVKKITWDWLAHTDGTAVKACTAVLDGELIAAVFTPDGGGTQPDNLYDVTVTDADSVDVLCGLGANLSNAATVVKKHTDGLGAVAGSVLTLNVSGAGDSNAGIVILYIR